MLYPIFLNLHGKSVLIVGGGAVALRKATALAHAGARVTVLSPETSAELQAIPHLRYVAAMYTSDWLKNRNQWRLVFAATNNPEINAHIFQDAEAAGIWCCRVDDADNSGFLNGAIAHEHGITLAVHTGASPVLGRRIALAAMASVDTLTRQHIELLQTLRPVVKEKIPSASQRRALLERLASDEVISLLRSHGLQQTHAIVMPWILQLQPNVPA